MEAVFIIHQWRPRFPAAGPARNREPGSGKPLCQTASGNCSNPAGGEDPESGYGCVPSGKSTAWTPWTPVIENAVEAVGRSQAGLLAAVSCPRSDPHRPPCPAGGGRCGQSAGR